MNMDEFKMTIEQEFEVDIPDATAHQMQTVGEAYVYLLRETRRKRPIHCSTSRTFYRLRQVLTTDLGVDRKRVRPSAAVWNLFPRKRRESACAQLETILGLPQLSGLVPAARPPTFRGLGMALAVGTVGAWLLNLIGLLIEKPESVAILFVIWFLVLLAVLEWFGIIWFVRFLGLKPVLKVRHLVVRLAVRDGERALKESQTGWTPATIWTKLAVMLSTQTGVPADNIRPENRWEELVVSMQLPGSGKTAPAREAQPQVKSRLWTMMIFLARVLAVLIRIVFYPIALLSWVSKELSGEGPRRRQLTRMFQERPPLRGPAFLALCGCGIEDATNWLAIRQVVAHCCNLPETAIYPYDDLSRLEWMMAPGPDAPWFDLGPNWTDVILQFEERLNLRIYSQELDERWTKAKSKREMETLNELATLLTEISRERRKEHILPGGRK